MSNYSNNNIKKTKNCNDNSCPEYRKKYGNMTTSTPRQSLTNSTPNDTFFGTSNQAPRQRYSWEDTDYYIEHYDHNDNAPLTPRRLFSQGYSGNDDTYNSQFSRVSSPGLVPFSDTSYNTTNPQPNYKSPREDFQNRNESEFSHLSSFNNSSFVTDLPEDDIQFFPVYASESTPFPYTAPSGGHPQNYDQNHIPSSPDYSLLNAPEDEPFSMMYHTDPTPLPRSYNDVDYPAKRSNSAQRKNDRTMTSPRYKSKKDKDKDDLNTKVNSINMLSVVISTVMLLAAEVSNIPANYVDWSTKYLKCIKNLQGQYPANVKKILNMLSMKEGDTGLQNTEKKCKCPHKDVVKRYK